MPDDFKYTSRVEGRYFSPVEGENQQVQMYSTRDPAKSDDDNWQEEQLASRQHQLDQLRARREISEEQYGSAMAGRPDRSLWDKVAQFKDPSEEMMGTWFQPVIDTLSTPLYAMTALAYGAQGAKIADENAFEVVPGLKLGFSTEEFKKSWSERRTFGTMAHNDFDMPWIAGLAADIALDPLTYMTFGVTAGLKVGVKAAGLSAGRAPVGIAKSLARKDDAVLTLNRHGQDLYHLAARKMSPDFDTALRQQNMQNIARGRATGEATLIEAERLRELHGDIGTYMVNNYDELVSELYGSRSALSKAARYPGYKSRELVESQFSLGRTADDMFEETASAAHRQIGFGEAKGKFVSGIIGVGIGGGIAGMAGDVASIVGAGLGGTAGWKLAQSSHAAGIGRLTSKVHGVDASIRTAWFRQQDLAKRELTEFGQKLESHFEGVTPAERNAVTYILEGADEASVKMDSTGRIISALNGTEYVSDNVVNAANRVKEEFADILRLEQEAGLKVESLEKYISRVYKDPNAQKLASTRVRDHKGIPAGARGGSNLGPQSFEMHRSIATIEDHLEHVGSGFIETDAMLILNRRKAASVKMINQEAFFKVLKDTAGMPAALIFDATKNAKPNAMSLKALLKNQSAANARLYQYDDYFGETDSLAQKLGFSIDISAPGIAADAATAAKSNIRLMDYLTKSFDERIASGAAANSFAKASKQASATFVYKSKGKTPASVDGNVLLRRISEGDDTLETIRELLQVGHMNMRDIQSFTRSLDDWSRKNFEAPLAVLVPNYMDNLKASMKRNPKFGWRSGAQLRSKTAAPLDNLLKDLRKEVKGRGYEGQLPKQIVDRAKHIRMRLSDFTDTIPAASNPERYKELQNLATTLGVHGNHLNEVSYALTGIKDISKLTVRELDRLTDYLGFHSRSYLEKAKREGSKDFDLVRKSLFGEEMEKITFTNREAPKFGKLADILKSRAREEGSLLATATKKLRVWQIDKQIDQANRHIDYLSDRITDHANRVSASGSGVASIKATAHVAAMSKRLQKLKDDLADFNTLRAKVLKEPESPLDPKSAGRKYMGREEMMEANAGSLSEKELDMYSKRFAFERRTHTVAHVAGKGGTDQLRKTRRAVKQKVGALEKNVKDATEKLLKAQDELRKVKAKADDVLAGTKVVDPEGSPAVVYRGERVADMGESTSGAFGPGIYFTEDSGKAARYAGIRGVADAKTAGASIRPAYLRMENPVDSSKPPPEELRAALVERLGKDITEAEARVRPDGIKVFGEKDLSRAREVLELLSDGPKLSKWVEADNAKHPNSPGWVNLFAGQSWMVADETKNIITDTAIHETIRTMGYDGIIGKSVMKPFEAEYVVFSKDQVISKFDASADKAKAVATEAAEKTREAAHKSLVVAEGRFGRYMKSLQDGKIELIGNGKYRVKETDEIFDIISFKDKRTDKFKFVGEYSEDLEKAIISDNILHGRTHVDSFRSVTSSQLPVEYAGPRTSSYYVSESIASLVRQINQPLYDSQYKAINTFWKGYDQMVQFFKIPMLAMWGATWQRNAIGNVTQGVLRAGMSLFHPENFRDMSRIWRYAMAQSKVGSWKGVSPEKIKKLGRMEIKALGDNHRGRPTTVAELYNEMGQRGVLSGMWTDEIDQTFSTTQGPLGKYLVSKLPENMQAEAAARMPGAAMGGAIGAGIGGPFVGLPVGMAIGALLGNHAAKMNWAFKAGEAVSEMPTRVMLGLSVYKETGSLMAMGDDVRFYLHDYSNLSTFEKKYLRRAMPFYNFFKMATRTVGTAAFEEPARVMLPHKIFTNQNMAGTMNPFGSPQDNPIMPEEYPDYQHDQLKFMGREIIDEKTGELAPWIKAGFALPMQEVGHMFDAVMPGGKSGVAMVSRGPFVVSSMIEYAFNYDTFRLGKIKPDLPGERTKWTNGKPFKGAPDWMKELIDYQTYDNGTSSVDPTVAWLLGETNVSRFTNIAKQVWKADEEEAKNFNYRALSKAVMAWTHYRYDPETQTYWSNKAKIDKMEELLAGIGRLKSYRQTYVVDPETGKSVKRTRSQGSAPIPFTLPDPIIVK